MLEPVQMETQIAGTCMVEDYFLYSIYVWYNLPKIGRQGTSSPPGMEIFLNMNTIECFFL